MPRTSVVRLSLTDFRSYDRSDHVLDGRPVWLAGPNGAGKTNLLEAVSFLIPGRGLRGSALGEVGRRQPGETQGRAWAVAATLRIDDDEVRLGSGIETAGSSRRVVRVEGEPAPPGRLAEYMRQVWLTPAQDRLFLEGAADRRRFFDRLVYAAEPAHAANVQAYEKAMRERMRLLTGTADPGGVAEGGADPGWLTALEARMAEAGVAVVAARVRTETALAEEIAARGGRAFPQARATLTGDWERMARDGASGGEIAARLASALAAGRDRDAGAGRGLTGPHRGDLAVIHLEKDRPAAECSTGEQKALLLNLVLAQAARLARDPGAPTPVVLLDEVAAHLDARRRNALYDEIEALGLQAFLTGTDQMLFDGLAGRAQGFRVEDGALTALD